MRLSSLVYTFFCKKSENFFCGAAERACNAPPRQNFYGKADSRMRLFGFELNAAFCKKIARR